MVDHGEDRGNGELTIVKEHYEYLEEQARKGNLEPERLLERLIENGDLLWGDEEEEDGGEEFEVQTREIVISRRHRELLAAQAAKRNRGTEEYAEMLIEIGASASFLRADDGGREPGGS